MKYTFLALGILFPVSVFADIIVKKDSKYIEDVTVVSITSDNIIYKQDGSDKTISSSDVDGILFDDGRYITPPHQQTFSEEMNTSFNDPMSMDDASDENTKIALQTENQAEKNFPRGNPPLMDKYYSKECRAMGDKVLKEVFKEEEKKIKQAQKSMTKEERQAAWMEALLKANEAGNQAVLECSGQ